MMDALVFLFCWFLSRPSIAETPTYLLAGDSFAVGLEHEFKALGKQQGFHAVGVGKVGSRVDQWVRWLPVELRRHRPKVVFLSLGSNDAVPEVDRLRKDPESITQIVLATERAGAKLVWVGPPTLPMKEIPHQDEVRTLIMARVPLYYDSTKLKIERGRDKIHSTPKGYKAWMGSLWDWTLGAGGTP